MVVVVVVCPAVTIGDTLVNGQMRTQLKIRIKNVTMQQTSKVGVQTVLPLIHSVARELEAIAEPQPNVLNLASTIRP